MQQAGYRFKTVAFLLLVWALASAPNLFKPVHIDDTAYLEITRAIRTDPCHVMAKPLNWGAENEPIAAVNQPHLFFYLLAGVDLLFGESELGYHLVEAGFSLAAIVFFHRLACHFAPASAKVLTILFALSPGYLPGQNIMCDVPMLACWLGFFCCLLLPVNDGRFAGRYARAGGFAAAACLIKYTSLVLLPILGLELITSRRLRYFWVFLIPLGALAAWSAWNWYEYGHLHLLGREGSSLKFQHLLAKATAWLVNFGSVAPFSILILPYLIRERKGFVTVLAGFLGLLGFLLQVFAFQQRPYLALMRCIFCANGVLLLGFGLHSLLSTWRQKNSVSGLNPEITVLLGWLVGAAGFIVLFTPFMAVRHVFVVMPVVLLLLGIHVFPKLARSWQVLAVTATLGLGFALSISDWVQADVYRRQAKEIRQRLGSDAKIWYLGHWGWQWYCDKEGMHQYDRLETMLQSGEYVVSPAFTPIQKIPPNHFRQLRLVEHISVPVTPLTRVRLWSWEPRGGYYFMWLAALPWTISDEPLEEFSIYIVE